MRQERFTVALALAFVGALLAGSAAPAVVEPPAALMETVPGPSNNATPAPAARNT